MTGYTPAYCECNSPLITMQRDGSTKCSKCGRPEEETEAIVKWRQKHANPAGKSSQAIKRAELLAEVAAVRQRQVAKGYDADHDDEHIDRSIAKAAAAYAMWSVGGADAYMADDLYPWRDGGPDFGVKQRDALLHAAALCVAEIERLDRGSSVPSANREGGE